MQRIYLRCYIYFLFCIESQSWVDILPPIMHNAEPLLENLHKALYKIKTRWNACLSRHELKEDSINAHGRGTILTCKKHGPPLLCFLNAKHFHFGFLWCSQSHPFSLSPFAKLFTHHFCPWQIVQSLKWAHPLHNSTV